MSYAISFCKDQLGAHGDQAVELPAAHRLLYLRSGSVVIAGEALSAKGVFGSSDSVVIQPNDELSEIWRWEVLPVNAPAPLFAAPGVHSHHVLTRPITNLNLFAGEPWLFRLDEMMFPPAHTVPCHTNAGPGIRCVKQGSFNFQEGDHGQCDMMPGTAFFEAGDEPCTAWGSRTMDSGFVRAMVLDRKYAGKMATMFPDRSKLKPGPKWSLLCDLEIHL